MCERQRIRVVNALWQTTVPSTSYSRSYCATTKDYFAWLSDLIQVLDIPCKRSSVLRQFNGRPCMLQWKWNCLHLKRRVTILFFPNRTIQFIGSLTDNAVYHLYCHCQQLFPCRLSFPHLKTMTVVYPLLDGINMTSLSSSNQHCVYEKDLFPGAQLTFWLPLHVILFHTGKITISGVKSFYQVDMIVNDLLSNKHFPLVQKTSE